MLNTHPVVGNEDASDAFETSADERWKEEGAPMSVGNSSRVPKKLPKAVLGYRSARDRGSPVFPQRPLGGVSDSNGSSPAIVAARLLRKTKRIPLVPAR
jgi:hypothetical protein